MINQMKVLLGETDKLTKTSNDRDLYHFHRSPDIVEYTSAAIAAGRVIVEKNPEKQSLLKDLVLDKLTLSEDAQNTDHKNIADVRHAFTTIGAIWAHNPNFKTHNEYLDESKKRFFKIISIISDLSHFLKSEYERIRDIYTLFNVFAEDKSFINLLLTESLETSTAVKNKIIEDLLSISRQKTEIYAGRIELNKVRDILKTHFSNQSEKILNALIYQTPLPELKTLLDTSDPSQSKILLSISNIFLKKSQITELSKRLDLQLSDIDSVKFPQPINDNAIKSYCLISRNLKNFFIHVFKEDMSHDISALLIDYLFNTTTYFHDSQIINQINRDLEKTSPCCKLYVAHLIRYFEKEEPPLALKAQLKSIDDFWKKFGFLTNPIGTPCDIPTIFPLKIEKNKLQIDSIVKKMSKKYVQSLQNIFGKDLEDPHHNTYDPWIFSSFVNGFSEIFLTDNLQTAAQFTISLALALDKDNTSDREALLLCSEFYLYRGLLKNNEEKQLKTLAKKIVQMINNNSGSERNTPFLRIDIRHKIQIIHNLIELNSTHRNVLQSLDIEKLLHDYFGKDQFEKHVQIKNGDKASKDSIKTLITTITDSISNVNKYNELSAEQEKDLVLLCCVLSNPQYQEYAQPIFIPHILSQIHTLISNTENDILACYIEYLKIFYKKELEALSIEQMNKSISTVKRQIFTLIPAVREWTLRHTAPKDLGIILTTGLDKAWELGEKELYFQLLFLILRQIPEKKVWRNMAQYSLFDETRTIIENYLNGTLCSYCADSFTTITDFNCAFFNKAVLNRDVLDIHSKDDITEHYVDETIAIVKKLLKNQKAPLSPQEDIKSLVKTIKILMGMNNRKLKNNINILITHFPYEASPGIRKSDILNEIGLQDKQKQRFYKTTFPLPKKIRDEHKTFEDSYDLFLDFFKSQFSQDNDPDKTVETINIFDAVNVLYYQDVFSTILSDKKITGECRELIKKETEKLSMHKLGFSLSDSENNQKTEIQDEEIIRSLSLDLKFEYDYYSAKSNQYYFFFNESEMEEMQKEIRFKTDIYLNRLNEVLRRLQLLQIEFLNSFKSPKSFYDLDDIASKILSCLNNYEEIIDIFPGFYKDIIFKSIENSKHHIYEIYRELSQIFEAINTENESFLTDMYSEGLKNKYKMTRDIDKSTASKIHFQSYLNKFLEEHFLQKSMFREYNECHLKKIKSLSDSKESKGMAGLLNQAKQWMNSIIARSNNFVTGSLALVIIMIPFVLYSLSTLFYTPLMGSYTLFYIIIFLLVLLTIALTSLFLIISFFLPIKLEYNMNFFLYKLLGLVFIANLNVGLSDEYWALLYTMNPVIKIGLPLFYIIFTFIVLNTFEPVKSVYNKKHQTMRITRIIIMGLFYSFIINVFFVMLRSPVMFHRIDGTTPPHLITDSLIKLSEIADNSRGVSLITQSPLVGFIKNFVLFPGFIIFSSVQSLFIGVVLELFLKKEKVTD